MQNSLITGLQNKLFLGAGTNELWSFSGEISSKHWQRYQWSFWHFGAYFGFFSWNSHICNKCQVQQRTSGVTGFFLWRGIGNLILWSNIAGTLYYRSLCTTPFFFITLSITTVVRAHKENIIKIYFLNAYATLHALCALLKLKFIIINSFLFWNNAFTARWLLSILL